MDLQPVNRYLVWYKGINGIIAFMAFVEAASYAEAREQVPDPLFAVRILEWRAPQKKRFQVL